MTRTLATGIEPRRVCRCGTSGFTLIELLLVIALIAMAGSLFVLNFNRLLSSEDSETVDDSLRRAVSAARFEAAARRTETALRWDAQKGQFAIIEYVSGRSLAAIALDADFASGGSGQIQFFPTQTQPGITAPFGSQQGEPLAQVRFSPDRSGTPFRAVITRPGAVPLELEFEPFSGMVLESGGSRL